MPDASTQNSPVMDVASHLAALEAIDKRQDEILGQLDALNERILRVLAENGVPAPKLPASLPPAFVRPKKAA
jgi:hypothetical protein